FDGRLEPVERIADFERIGPGRTVYLCRVDDERQLGSTGNVKVSAVVRPGRADYRFAFKQRPPGRRPRKNQRTHAASWPHDPIEPVMRAETARHLRHLKSQLAVGVDAEPPAEWMLAAAQRPRMNVAVELPVPATGQV